MCLSGPGWAPLDRRDETGAVLAGAPRDRVADLVGYPHVPPGPYSEFPLDALVAVPHRVVVSQPVPEAQHALHLGRAYAEDVQIDGGVRPLEQPVLEPLGLPDPQDVAGTLHLRHVARLVGRIRHHKQDVDDGFGHQAGDRRRPDVLDAQRHVAKDRAKALRLAAEQPRPVRVVCHKDDRGVVRFQPSHGDLLELLITALFLVPAACAPMSPRSFPRAAADCKAERTPALLARRRWTGPGHIVPRRTDRKRSRRYISVALKPARGSVPERPTQAQLQRHANLTVRAEGNA